MSAAVAEPEPVTLQRVAGRFWRVEAKFGFMERPEVERGLDAGRAAIAAVWRDFSARALPASTATRSTGATGCVRRTTLSRRSTVKLQFDA